ncbi:MAG: glutamine-hydrolyzing carbamoyl-phosphate synthase small subunit [Bacteroidales bacterium]|nr:glutamine-hydrolyzing carbamoyl-phosphate synthase small subunit [Bacteroidales bacterium]
MRTRKKVKLVLQNGRTMEGWGFGYDGPCDGEVVFSTAMVGYTESLTDPSFSGQILCATYPLIGNYGISPMENDEGGLLSGFESEKIHIRGLIVTDYSEEYSHWDAVKSLGDWMNEQKVPGISGIDTRLLTQILREEGSMLGKIVPADEPDGEFCVADPNKENQVELVSCKEVMHYGAGEKKVVLVDCGVKHQILRCLIARGVEIIRVPWDYDFNQMEWDGLFISNGPGDPVHCAATVEHIRRAMQTGKPICGICLGNQLLGIAAGATTYKLKYGHRSHNQPVRQAGTDRCYITAQNHGYALDESTLPADWEPYFINMNDGTNEGIRHKSKPFFSAQFHPEASSGPEDTEFIFDDFISQL